MKSLVVYYSYTNNNKVLAKEVAARLNTDIEEITEAKKRSTFTCMTDLFFRKFPKITSDHKSPGEYDRVILIAPVWGGMFAAPLKTYLRLYSDEIKHYAFITVSGGALGPNKKLFQRLEKYTGKETFLAAELYVADLLPAKDKNKMSKTSIYKLTINDLNTGLKEKFDALINGLRV